MIRFTTQAEFATWATRRAKFPITDAAELIALRGNDTTTVHYLGHKLTLGSLRQLPAGFFPVKDEADLVARMNDSQTYLQHIGAIKPGEPVIKPGGPGVIKP